MVEVVECVPPVELVTVAMLRIEERKAGRVAAKSREVLRRAAMVSGVVFIDQLNL